jgi:AcrR family transcriptional regulator
VSRPGEATVAPVGLSTCPSARGRYPAVPLSHRPSGKEKPLAPTAKAPTRRGRPPTVAADDIVRVTTDLISQRGLRDTTLAGVAERLGITDGGLLHYFPTKTALFDAVIERAVERQVERMRTFTEPGGLAAIRRFREWGTVNEETPELVALQVLISSEAILPQSPVREQQVKRYAAVHDLAAGLIREAIDRGEARPDVDADWEASALIAYLDGVRLQWFYSDRSLPMADFVRRYVDALVERIRLGGTAGSVGWRISRPGPPPSESRR